jgi:hypothetical protein
MIKIKKLITLAATLLALICNNNGNNTVKNSDDANSKEAITPAHSEASGNSTADTEITVIS